jgi:hypothetical protein
MADDPLGDRREYDEPVSYAVCPDCGHELADVPHYGEGTLMCSFCQPQQLFWRDELSFDHFR